MINPPQHEKRRITYTMKTPWKTDYWANFWTWNKDISGSRKAMNAFERAFKTWELILVLQKMLDAVEIKNLKYRSEEGALSGTFLFWKKFLVRKTISKKVYPPSSFLPHFFSLELCSNVTFNTHILYPIFYIKNME